MLSSGQGLKMMRIKQELKISNLFLRGFVGFEGKMNDERMISQTPMVHKLDEVSSLCLAYCSKYVRESQWRRVREEEWIWSLILASFPAARKRRERMCVMSCWLACLAASQWGSEKRKTGQDCPARKACVEESERMLPRFLLLPREVTRAEWHEIFSLVENMSSGPKQSKYSCTRQ